MNSKQAAKLAFGNPGFLDFLAPVTNFLRPITTPLVKSSTQLSGAFLDRLTGSNLVSQTFAKPEVQKLGQDLAAVGIVSGAAVAGGAVAAPLLAGVSLPSLGALGGLGSSVVNNPDVTDFLLNGDSEFDPFSDDSGDDDNDPGGEED